MITHVVAFRWKPGTTAEQVSVIHAELTALASMVPTIRTYRVGADLGRSPLANFDFAVVATFDDLDGWQEYDVHPEHDRVRTAHIRPWIAERAAVQFES